MFPPGLQFDQNVDPNQPNVGYASGQQGTYQPDVAAPPSSPPSGGGGTDPTGNTRIPNPRFPRIPAYTPLDAQSLLYGPATGAQGSATATGTSGAPGTPNGLQYQSNEQMLQDLFTGKQRVIAGQTNMFPAGFDPSIFQKMGDTFDQKFLDSIKPWLEMMGIKVQYKPSDNGLPSGRITLKDGTVVDLNNNGKWGWIVRGNVKDAQGGGGNGSGQGSGFGGLGSGSPFGNLTQRSNDLWNMLWGRANQSLNINRNDPIIRNLSDAYAAMQQRASRQYLQQQAEKQGSYSNMSAEERLAAQEVAQNTSAFESKLMKDELTARRQEIAQALQLLEGQLTSEEDLSLRLYLGQLDAQIRLLGLSEQMREFNDSLAQRAFEFDVSDEFRRSPLAS